MFSKKIIPLLLSLFFCLSLSAVTKEEIQNNQAYFLPLKHPLKKNLDKIFSSNVLFDQTSFDKAGFVTLYHQPSGMRVASHPLLPGYLIKTFLDNEQRKTGSIDWQLTRCQEAENLRHLIHSKKLKHFSVPDKWIYLLPGQPFEDPQKQCAILVVTDMNLVSQEESISAWQTKITPSHLKELYTILSRGLASCFLPFNIPYCKNGQFACVDTAYRPRVHDLTRVNRYLSNEMQSYWNHLVEKRSKKNVIKN
jgi:hypothetical protein